MENLRRSGQTALSLDRVCKRFGGVVASDEVSLDLRYGETFGLIGPNGSGKTTLINLITGIYRVDSGVIKLPDGDITNISTHARARRGIVRTFQTPRLLKGCDLYANIYLGMDLARKRKLKSDDALLARLLEAAGLRINLKDSIDKLSFGQQKLLEIVRAILTGPDVILLDEPAAGLNHAEMEYIKALIAVAHEQNTAVLLIEHAMDLVMSICDRITVLNFGHQIASGTPEDIQDNPAVIEAYLGRGRSA